MPTMTACKITPLLQLRPPPTVALLHFANSWMYRPEASAIAAGLTLFAISLCKKIVVADGVAPDADPVFDSARSGATPTMTEARYSALAFTFQHYFDFSVART